MNAPFGARDGVSPMSILLQRIVLAASLAMVPAFSFAASDTEETKVETSAKEKADDDDADAKAEADSDDGDEQLNAEQEALAAQDAEWAEKLRKRHHEGDVALGVCGARMTVLMWFYQASVADGRDDLEPAYDSIKESRTVLKNEAERRAIEEGVGTSVSVMNEYSTELWEELVAASEEPETFQEAHDALFTDVQECLTLFFKRGKTVKKAEPADTDEEEATEEEPEEEKAD